VDAVRKMYNHPELVNKFFELALKYKFHRWVDHLEYVEVKNFLNELYGYSDK
jgi:hypothetical protein